MPTKLQNYCALLFAAALFFSLPSVAQTEAAPSKKSLKKKSVVKTATKKKPKQAVKSRQKPTPAPAPAPTPVPDPTWEQRAIRGNIVVSSWFDDAAEFLDLLLAGQRVTTNRNQSSFRIENSTVWTEGEGATNGTAFNINLRLPNVEESWNLKFTSYDEQREQRGTQNAQFRRQVREQNYGATIGVFRKLGRIRTSFEPRIELQDPLRTSHLLAFETTVDLEEGSQMVPKIELFATSERGTGIFNHLNFYFPLGHVYSLALINQSTYEDKLRLFSVANGFAISRPVLRNAGISYSFFFNSDNAGAYSLVSYTLAATWSQFIYKNILDYNITPHIDFTKPRSFTGQMGLDFNIGLKF